MELRYVQDEEFGNFQDGRDKVRDDDEDGSILSGYAGVLYCQLRLHDDKSYPRLDKNDLERCVYHHCFADSGKCFLETTAEKCICGAW